MMRSVSSSAASRPIDGIGARAEAVRHLAPDRELVGYRRGLQRLHIGVHHMELDSRDTFAHHARDGIGSTAAHADDFDPRAEQRFVFLDFELQMLLS